MFKTLYFQIPEGSSEMFRGKPLSEKEENENEVLFL